jgi:hypothetical protein
MDSLCSLFKEAAALTVGVAGAALSTQAVFTAVDLLFAAGGVPPGLVTGMIGLAMVGTGAAAGGAIGYKGTMAVANEVGEALGGTPSAEAQTTGPIVRAVAKALPEVASRSYLFPYRWPDFKL